MTQLWRRRKKKKSTPVTKVTSLQTEGAKTATCINNNVV